MEKFFKRGAGPRALTTASLGCVAVRTRRQLRRHWTRRIRSGRSDGGFPCLTYLIRFFTQRWSQAPESRPEGFLLMRTGCRGQLCAGSTRSRMCHEPYGSCSANDLLPCRMRAFPVCVHRSGISKADVEPGKGIIGTSTEREGDPLQSASTEVECGR